MPSTVEVFADVSCPFAHVSLRRLVERRRDTGAKLTLIVRAWPLELVNGEPLDPELVGHKVEALREQVTPNLFHGFDEVAFPSTFIPAMALAAAAYRLSSIAGEQVSLALRDAIFEEGRDVADPDVLGAIARAAGVAEVSAADHQRVLDDWAEGKARGVQGSPHFFLDGNGFFCPSLRISNHDGHLEVHADPAGFDRFFAAVS